MTAAIEDLGVDLRSQAPESPGVRQAPAELFRQDAFYLGLNGRREINMCRLTVVSVNWWKIVGPHISELGN